LIGDELMALYVPPFTMPSSDAVDDRVRRHIADVMLKYSRQLLERAGHGSSGEPDLAIGIGLDFGEAFVGNIGDTAVRDFTAVGDVVNTASRLSPTRPVARFCSPHGWLAYGPNLSACPS
jgi:adenylate cyclase